MAEGFSTNFAQKVLKVINNEGDAGSLPALDHLAIALWSEDPTVDWNNNQLPASNGYVAVSIDQSSASGGSGTSDTWDTVGATAATASLATQTDTDGDITFPEADGGNWNGGTGIPYMLLFGKAVSAPSLTSGTDFILYSEFGGVNAIINDGDTAKISGGNLTITIS